MSATVAPAVSLSTTPSSAGSQFATRLALVAGAEESLRAVEEAFVVFVIAHAAAGAERLGHLRLAEVARGEDFEAAAQEHGAVLVGQHQGVLVGQLVAQGGRVVGDVATCGLVVEPFPHVAFGGAGALGEFGRGERSGACHGLVEAQFVADVHQGAGHGDAHVGNGLCTNASSFCSLMVTVSSRVRGMSSTRGAPGPPVGSARSVLAVAQVRQDAGWAVGCQKSGLGR